jgi:hypothetical protein
MKILKPRQPVAIIYFFTGFLLLISVTGCVHKPKNDPGSVAINPKFENEPPPVGDISIRQLKDNKDGNVLFIADFGKALGNEKFHAINVGEEKMVLRDDGKNGDEKGSDGKFSIVLNEDINSMETQFKNTIEGLRKDRTLVSFNGRTMIQTPIEQLDLKGFEAFKKGELLKLPPFFIPCLFPAILIKKENSLMVTAPQVVEDSSRTFNPCSGIGNPNGAWAFPKLVSEMANTGSTGVSAKDFLMNWLKSWTADQVVNTDVITKRTQINDIINTWSSMSGGTFDIKFAPFKLIAIVNRVDLRGSSGYGFTNPGEGRFVFCAINCNNKILSVKRSPAPFMVIFEYGLPFKTCAELKTYGQGWADLSTMVLGSPVYNKSLEKLTIQFTAANTSPGKPNGSSLNQVRTNEFALHPLPPAQNVWELREFNIDKATHMLVNVTVKQEPQTNFNRIHIPNNPGDVKTMADFINTHTAAVEASTYKVELLEAGKHFAAGKAHTINPFSYHWDGAPPPPNPSFIVSDSARFIFSLNTCSGCHGGEANTGNFMHVAPGGLTGVPAILSGFLKGNPPMSAGGFIVTDRANRPPPIGKPRAFNDLERRKLDLQKLISCPCKSPTHAFALAEALRQRPVNMTH